MKNFFGVILSKYKGVSKIQLLLRASLVLCVVAVFWFYNQNQAEKICLQHVEYRGSRAGYYRIIKDNGGKYDSRMFKTQNEAMKYCMKVLGADF